MSILNRPRIAGLLAAAALALAVTQAIAADLEVTGAWARATPPGAKTGGAYLTVVNHGAADKLVAVVGIAAERIELHNHTMEGAVMKMRQVPFIDVPMHGKAELQPGGYHVMLMGLKGPLKEGDMLMLTLKFEKAGEKMVHLPIMKKAKPNMGGGMNHEHKHGQ